LSKEPMRRYPRRVAMSTASLSTFVDGFQTCPSAESLSQAV
jgi:hypothetical protein